MADSKKGYEVPQSVGEKPVSNTDSEWDLEKLKSQFCAPPAGFFDPSILGEITERDVDFLQDLYGGSRYVQWRDVYYRIDLVYAEAAQSVRRGVGGNWKYVALAEESREWDRVIELTEPLDKEYADVARKQNLVRDLRDALGELPLAPVFLMGALARLAETSKLGGLETRKEEDDAASKVRETEKRLVDSLGPLLSTQEADQRETEKRKTLRRETGDSRSVESILDAGIGLWMRTTFLGVTLDDILLQDTTELRDYLSKEDPEWLAHSGDSLTALGLFQLLELVIRCRAERIIEANEFDVSKFVDVGLPSRQSPRKDSPTDYSFLAFEGVLRLSGKVDVAKMVCDLWGLSVTHSQLKDWRKSKRGERALCH